MGGCMSAPAWAPDPLLLKEGASSPSWDSIVSAASQAITLGTGADDGCKVMLLPANETAWSLYRGLIQSSRKSIVLVMWYVFKKDPYSREVLSLLLSKLQQGVQVTLVFPDVDQQELEFVLTNNKEGWSDQEAFTQRLGDAGAKLIDFTQFVPSRGSHRKALIIDESVCLMGSRNIHALYYEPLNSTVATNGDNSPWDRSRDTPHFEMDVLIEGPRVVKPIVDALVSNKDVSLSLSCGLALHQCAPTTLLKINNTIEDEYVRRIDSAIASIVLVNLSFLPRKPVLHALQSAVKRGLSVAVVTNGLPTSAELKLAACNLITRELRCEVYLNTSYHLLHCKYAVFDGTVAAVGSFNFDEWSYTKNAEDLLVLPDASVARLLTSHATWLAKTHCVRRSLLPKPSLQAQLEADVQGKVGLLISRLGY